MTADPQSEAVRGLSLAGFAATLLTYGPARVGFGLFLPQLRPAFGIEGGASGTIASIGFAGFLAGLVAAGELGERFGGTRPVLIGLICSTLGLAMVAFAGSAAVLAAGVALAMLGPGLTWSPFNRLVHDGLSDFRRPGALSVISTGTSLGIALAGAAALLVALWGVSWRWAWVFFALLGLGALAVNARLLTRLAPAPRRERREFWSGVRRRRAAPLYAVAFSFGITTAIWITFAARTVEQAGGLPGLPANGSSAAIFVALGLAGLAGIGTARVRRAIGLPALVAALMLAAALSAALLALAPASWPGVMASAALQGVFIMMTSAVLSFWAERIFAGGSLLGFTAALLFVAAGSIAGPAIAGLAYDRLGAQAVFLALAALSAASAPLALPRFVRIA
ncbi:MFS transporter [Erythrobacter sp. HL-111]|uniref:MFS transporter n=1 Tax=Erythrobacter sp. HL-111 TaxID=1798193 RepID=UPI0006DB9D06|nr:MFS transporter [Erythrobacter sp. HL-111]KPP92190.1 MAG: Arabinose efflux permease [Erythrobacteraceae bacterium HL-111]SDS38837.1 Predicted arabinose efflux permease, MFS family [Erythrobacter sp. HL-111]